MEDVAVDHGQVGDVAREETTLRLFVEARVGAFRPLSDAPLSKRKFLSQKTLGQNTVKKTPDSH